MGSEKFEEISLLCQLGINRDTLLKKIVGESNFENYTIEFQDKLYYKIYPVKGYKEKEPANKDDYFIKDMYDEKLRKNFGWRVTLRPDQKGKKYEITPELSDRIEDKSKSVLRIDGVHAGHLLGKVFYKNNYIPLMKCGSKDVYFRKSKIGKKNKYNIYTQSKNANCNSKDQRGQNYYEGKIDKYLERSSDGIMIYYEVEAIFLNKENKVPIGNRIKAELISTGNKNNVTNEEFEKIHVFIPNIAYDEKSGKFSFVNGWDIPD